MFQRIIDIIKRNLLNNKKVSVFFICLLLASFFWLLNALNKVYTELVEIPVKIESVPKEMVLVGTPPSTIQFRVKGTGFNLIGIDNNWVRDSLSIYPDDIVAYKKNNRYQGVVSTGEIQREVAKEFGSSVEILEVSADTFKLLLEVAKREELKVKLQSALLPSDQYKIKSITLSPNMVEVSGPYSEVDNISRVKTDSLLLSNFSENKKGEIALKPPCFKCSVIPNKVKYSIEVEPVTETIIEVPVHFVNVPSNVIISAHPKTIEITCLVGLSEYNQLNSDMFLAAIDYKNIELYHPSKANIEILSKPDFVEIGSYYPQRVEYIYRTK